MRPGKDELLKLLRDNESRLQARKKEIRTELKRLHDEADEINHKLEEIQSSRHYLESE